MKILFKYPSRGRRRLFEEGMYSIVNNVYDTKNYQVLVSADHDDPEMNHTFNFPNTTIFYSKSDSKVHAVNRDIEKADSNWDIIVVMSDDMRFNIYGFDELIRQEFRTHGLDTLLHVPDQDAKTALATMYIAGRDYYKMFGYIYHPDYKSLFCDNEVMDVAKKLGKYRYANILGMITHLNPAYGHLPKDEMFLKQQEIGWSQDQQTYTRRKSEIDKITDNDCLLKYLTY